MNMKGIAMIGSVMAVGLVVSACGAGTTGNAPIRITLSSSEQTIPKQPASISLLDASVAHYLTTDLHIKKVIINQAPTGTVGLKEFLAHPSTATADALHTGPIPVSSDGWMLLDGVVTLPQYSSASAEESSISQFAQSTIGSLPTATQRQIKTSPKVFIDFAYGPYGDLLGYSIFYWGSPTPPTQ